MNTQLNNTQPDITRSTVNGQIMTIISDTVMGRVEREDETAQCLAEFNAVIAAVKGHISTEQLRTLENAPWFIALPYGFDMFLEGLRIGRDPMALLTLGEGNDI